MDKRLDLNLLFPAQLFQFPQRQLSGRNDPADAQFFQETDRFRGCDRQLGAGMEEQTGTRFPDGVDHPQVLDNDAVQTGQIQPADIGCQLRQLVLPGQGVDGQVDLSAKNMGFPDGPDQLFLCEIVCVRPGSEFLSGQIKSIRPC